MTDEPAVSLSEPRSSGHPDSGTNPDRSPAQHRHPDPDGSTGRHPVGRCGGCDAWWTGERTAHCAAAECHRTFTSPRAFDVHRFHGTCREPSNLGMVEHQRTGYTAWGFPADEAAAERFRALRDTAGGAR